MRICRLVWAFPRIEKVSYGLGPNFYYVSREQVRKGLDIEVIAKKGNNEPNYEEIEGIKVHRVRPPYNINGMTKLAELDRTRPFDIVHAHGTCGISYPLLKFKIRAPLVVHAHGTALGATISRSPYTQVSSIKEFLKSRSRISIAVLRQRVYWQLADMLIAVSFFLKKEIEELYNINESKIEVAYNGVDTSIFKKDKGAEDFKRQLGLEGKRIILYVGHFGLGKGILYLIGAMPKIIREEPDAFLLCVGGTPKWLGSDIYYSILEKRLRELDLHGRARLLGQVPHQSLPRYYSIADVFAFPSLYEAMSKVVIEAMACEIPVVASGVGGIKEVIEDGMNGLLIQPRDVNSLQKSIVRVLQDTKMSRELARKGRETIESRFTWEHTVMQISKAYERIASRGLRPEESRREG